ncbi:MAG: hypothetical protein ACP5UV_03105, partial [Thermoplasmata archaeon]
SAREKKVYDAAEGLSFSEMREKTKLPEADLKDAILSLESSYMMRRKIKDGVTVYLKNDLKCAPEDKKTSLKRIISLILSAFGPQTIEEIEIRIPLPKEEIEDAADALVQSGEAFCGYVTPVYSKQYILNSDIKAMMSEFNVLDYRLKKLSMIVSNEEEYFEHYGFAFDEMNLRSRIGSDFKEISKSRRIFKGRYIKVKMTYLSEWLADVLYSLRYEDLSEMEQKVMDLIERGYGTEKIIAEKSGYDRKIIRQIIRSLEFKIRLTHENSLMVPIKPKKISDTQAMEMLLKKYGPISFEELRRFFWIRITGIKSAAKVYYNGSVYYSSGKEDYKDTGIIISINDPVSMYLRIYTDSIDYNRIFIYGGKEILTYEEEIRNGIVWISDLNIYEKEHVDEFIHAVKSFYGHSVVVINDSGGNINFDGDSDLFRSGNLIMSIQADTINGDEASLMAAALSHLQKKEISPGSTYETFSSFLFGIRDGIESSYYGISDSVLERYYDSGLLFQFNGPFNQTAYGTKEVISLYRAIRNTAFDKDEQEIVRLILANDSVSEREIMETLYTSIKGLKSKLSSLYSKCALAKDSMRKYIYVGEKYTRDEALDIIRKYAMKFFGFLTTAAFAGICGISQDEAQIYLNSRKLKKYVCVETKDMYYSEKEIGESKKKTTRIVTDRDMIALFFSDFIKRKFGSQINFYYVYRSDLVLGISARRENHTFHIKKISGDSGYLQDMKKEFFRIGFSLDVGDVIKRE